MDYKLVEMSQVRINVKLLFFLKEEVKKMIKKLTILFSVSLSQLFYWNTPKLLLKHSSLTWKQSPAGSQSSGMPRRFAQESATPSPKRCCRQLSLVPLSFKYLCWSGLCPQCVQCGPLQNGTLNSPSHKPSLSTTFR